MIDPTLLTHVVTLLGGGAAATVVNRIFDRKKDQLGELALFRAELIGRVDKLQGELDDWKQKYFTREEEVAQLRAQVLALKGEIAVLRRELDIERQRTAADRERVPDTYRGPG